MGPLTHLRALCSDSSGAIAIETAIVAPVLAMLSVGSFEVSSLIARQTELQSAAGVAQSVALSSAPDTPEELATLKQIIMESTGLSTGKVTLTNSYRCGIQNVIVASKTACSASEAVTTYLTIHLTDTYTPAWTKFGVADPVQYDVTRRMTVS
jgi:Flp pilus assembly protein TadG